MNEFVEFDSKHKAGIVGSEVVIKFSRGPAAIGYRSR